MKLLRRILGSLFLLFLGTCAVTSEGWDEPMTGFQMVLLFGGAFIGVAFIVVHERLGREEGAPGNLKIAAHDSPSQAPEAELAHEPRVSYVPKTVEELQEQLKSDFAGLARLGAGGGLVTFMGGVAGGVILTVVGYAYRVFIMELGAWPSLLAVFSQNGVIVFGIGFVFGAFYYLTQVLGDNA